LSVDSVPLIVRVENLSSLSSVNFVFFKTQI